MNAFLVLAVAIGVVSADVSSLGYQYSAPQTSYGLPSQVGAASNNFNTAYAFKGQSQGYQGVTAGPTVVTYPTGSVGNVFQGVRGSGYQSGVGTGFQSGSSGLGFQSGSAGSGFQSGSVGTGYQSGGAGFQSGGAGFQSGGAGFQSGGAGFQSGGAGFQSGSSGSGFQFGGSSGSAGLGYQSGGAAGSGSGSFLGGSGSSQGFQSSNKYSSQYQQKYQQVQYQQQPAQVFKHFYVHAAPEDQEVAKTRQPVVLPPAQKHYKIIFIKTPSAAAGAAQIAPVVPQTEEKTIVYVLVKKPEEIQDVAVPKIDQKPPSKPEVYFIKYKNKDDSQAVINNIVSDYNKGQQTVSFSGLGADAGGVSVGGSGFSGESGVSGGSAFGSAGSSGFGSSGSSGFGSSGSSGFGSSGSSGFGSSGSSGFGASGNSGFGTSSNLGFSGSSGLSGGSGLTGFSESAGLSGGSSGFGVTVDSGSYSGQYDASNAGSTIGPFVVSSTESGLSGVSFGQGEGQATAGFGSTGYSQGSGSLGGITISKSEPISQAVTTGYETSDLASGVSGIVGSSTVNYDVNAISSSQGVPHETYGVPTFKTQ